MRRRLTAVALGATLLISAGCGGQDKDRAAAQPATATPTAASPTRSPAADHTADTKKVCGVIDKALEGEMKGFAEDLQRMIAYEQAGNTGGANQAKVDAQTKLKAIATRMRERTAAAQDPELKAAGRKSADKMEASAADEALFGRLKKLDDVQSLLEKDVVTWLAPVAKFCA